MLLRPFIALLMLAAFTGQSSFAAEGLENGKAIYEKRCWWCHGKEGAGDGPASQHLNPPPRDLTLGLYKWKSTPFDELSPSDDDFYNMIAGGPDRGIHGWTGLGDTSMPGWADLLSRQDIKDVAAYIKTFAGLEKALKPPVSLSGKISPDKDGLLSGRKLFKDNCSECHGEAGRGDGTKKLKDDWGARTWPRDLTKGWTFRMGNRPEDIYTRVTVGIPGTQMPSFADPASRKVMTEAERWEVANYAASLDEPERRPVTGVLKAVKTDGSAPTQASDRIWDRAGYATYHLFPQIIAGERAYTPSLNSVSIKAVYDQSDIAFLIEWDDPTNSMPWDEKAQRIADGVPFPDGFAIQFPAEIKGAERPYFGMGGPKPVAIWSWQSPGSEDSGQTVKSIEARGAGRLSQIDDHGVSATGAYENGRWRVVVKGPLRPGKGPVLEEGRFIPVAFAAWDGSNGDNAGKHVMTGWEWAVLEKEAPRSFNIWPFAIGALVFAAEMFWLFSARRR
ncbi:MAG TPA: hypothetical protein DDW94_05570 [Deltaproteobacteria bacterium]|nr:MAG: hypothetical protein A2Z79_04375 [Deltaproteobacteria bacterium GWA2_55_82]OGQ64160.1 MAG: hypothetical protein A3I81_10760 [Deltaproteobacteria bacterium RIFCSPLOWO2_02_FULL_55_12]OIJ74613.1 MAG: hypothetical protein A2V21_310285 [Deltaproteobacteria bacterium GWC2_55_46]HBG46443.1 hypothetical protein [Deltaproteobacteria bacterium]HCY10655.1 hypothetical protein [Deltaproteobacteria bacterium]